MLETQNNSQGFRAVRWKSSRIQDLQPQAIKKQGRNNWCCSKISSDTCVCCFPDRVVQEACARRKSPLVLIALKYQNSSTAIPPPPPLYHRRGGKMFESTEKDALLHSLRYWEALKSFYLFRTITKKIHTGPSQEGQRKHIICIFLSDIY